MHRPEVVNEELLGERSGDGREQTYQAENGDGAHDHDSLDGASDQADEVADEPRREEHDEEIGDG